MSTELRPGIHWVGYVDWDIRDFHGYESERGSTYNAFLVRDEKTALIDTVKAPFAGDLLRSLSALVEPSSVDYVVCNHAEPDHSGALPHIMASIPSATLLADRKCLEALAYHYDTSDWRTQTVGTGDTVSLGRRRLQFLETPMVHWPESMFTYVPEENLLFSMDAFGQHYATSQRFDDQVPLCTLMEEAKTYYANIIMPYGSRVAAVLRKVEELDIDLIAPSHGLAWRSNAPRIVDAYRNWATCRPRPKALVIYDSMWQSTGRMAAAIAEGASVPGVEVKLIHIRRWSLTRIATEVLDAAAIAFGSSTLNQGMMPMAGAVLTYLQGLRPVGKSAFSFGSYGWGKGGPEALGEGLEALKWNILREPLKARYRPTPDDLDECRAAGKLLAERAVEAAAERPLGERVCVDP